MERYKRYIDVVVMHKKEGRMIPLFIYWDDRGERYKYQIDSIIEIKKSVSVVGGGGILYRCKIKGQIRNVYFERDKWFIESKVP